MEGGLVTPVVGRPLIDSMTQESPLSPYLFPHTQTTGPRGVWEETFSSRCPEECVMAAAGCHESL